MKTGIQFLDVWSISLELLEIFVEIMFVLFFIRNKYLYNYLFGTIHRTLTVQKAVI